MRINLHIENASDGIEIVSEDIQGVLHTGLRIPIELSPTTSGGLVLGPFLYSDHQEYLANDTFIDEDSSSITIWSKGGFYHILTEVLSKLGASDTNN